MNKKSLLIILCFLINFITIGQISETQNEINLLGVKQRFYAPALGYSQITFRDFATSPLIYSGVGASAQLGWIKLKGRTERKLEFFLIMGFSNTQAPESKTFQTKNKARIFNGNVYYDYLVNLPKFSKGKYTLNAGGAFQTSANFRTNTSLNNNSTGIEAFSNFMLALKCSKDVSRSKEKIERFLFIKRNLKPCERSLSFQLNTGILNFNYRPGYAYNGMSELDGSKTNPFSYLLDKYQWSFNGVRVGTRIEFTKKRASGNIQKWAYLWDFISAPGMYESFKMASHRIQYSIMINRN
jgi:hypothetical protein